MYPKFLARSSFHSKRACQEGGFSLIELLAILILLSLLVAISLVWPGRFVNLQAQMEQITSDIRYVQHLAMSERQFYRIHFYADHYQLTDASDQPVDFRTRNQSTVSFDPSMTLTTSLTNQYLMFDGEGIPYDSPTTPLTVTAQLILSLPSEGKVMTLTISPDTGTLSL